MKRRAAATVSLVVLCAAGVLLSIVLARLRKSALDLKQQPHAYPHIEHAR